MDFEAYKPAKKVRLNKCAPYQENDRFGTPASVNISERTVQTILYSIVYAFFLAGFFSSWIVLYFVPAVSQWALQNIWILWIAGIAGLVFHQLPNSEGGLRIFINKLLCGLLWGFLLFSLYYGPK